jgi:hypothetical protein
MNPLKPPSLITKERMNDASIFQLNVNETLFSYLANARAFSDEEKVEMAQVAFNS